MTPTRRAPSVPWVGGLGYYRQPDSSDYWLRARVYNQAIGRFVSRDPVRQPNGYWYAGTSPVVRVDPSGRRPNGPECTGAALYGGGDLPSIPEDVLINYTYKCKCGGGNTDWRCQFPSPWAGVSASQGKALHGAYVRIASVSCNCQGASGDKQSCTAKVEKLTWQGPTVGYEVAERETVKGCCIPPGMLGCSGDGAGGGPGSNGDGGGNGDGGAGGRGGCA